MMFRVGINQYEGRMGWFVYVWHVIAGVITGFTLVLKASLVFNCCADAAFHVFALRWPWVLAVVFSTPALLFHLGRRVGRFLDSCPGEG